MQRAVSQVDALEAAIHHCLDHVHDMLAGFRLSAGHYRAAVSTLPPPRTFRGEPAESRSPPSALPPRFGGQKDRAFAVR
jgi:hypothetical protein